jgi:hypothetical protein
MEQMFDYWWQFSNFCFWGIKNLWTASTETRRSLSEGQGRSPPSLKLRRVKVELGGFEPPSKQETKMFSTCLACYRFS